MPQTEPINPAKSANSAVNAAISSAVAQIKSASASGTALRIRGGGSKDFYGQSLHGDILDTRALTGITSYEPSELVVTVQAGTPLAELESALAQQGQCLPFEPPHFQFAIQPVQATVGGMVAAALSGPARASAGGVRDFMLGVQIINGRGELLTFGGQVMKNVAGYDVSRLMAGSMGTLGLITQVSLKVLPVAPAEATLVFELPQAQALAQLHRWGGQALPLNASCWIHDDTARPGGRDLLFVRLRGAVAAVASACQTMLRETPGERLNDAEAHADWRACRDQTLPFFKNPASSDHVLWRLSVAQTAAPLALPWPQLIEWHGGLRWLWAPLSAMADLRLAASRAGGHATAFRSAVATGSPSHSADRSAWPVFTPLKSPLDSVHHRLKAEFDAANVFNPGRLFAQK